MGRFPAANIRDHPNPVHPLAWKSLSFSRCEVGWLKPEEGLVLEKLREHPQLELLGEVFPLACARAVKMKFPPDLCCHSESLHISQAEIWLNSGISLQICSCRTGIGLFALSSAQPQPAAGEALGWGNGEVKFPELGEAAGRLISTLSHDH